MSDMIKVPGFGPTKKTTVYLVGGGLVLVAAVGYYRSKHPSAAPAATPADTSAADQAAADAAAAGTGYGAGYGSGGGANYAEPPTPATGYTTNGAWSQAAEDYLVNTVHSGSNADLIGNALGKYITGQQLTSDQVAIVEQAIAFVGYPPVNGPSGYPPSYRTAAPAAGTTTTTTKPGRANNLHAVNVTTSSIRVDWDAVAGVKGYHMRLDGREITSSVYSVFTFSGLKKGHSYSIGVIPFNSAGDGPQSTIHASTHKK